MVLGLAYCNIVLSNGSNLGSSLLLTWLIRNKGTMALWITWVIELQEDINFVVNNLSFSAPRLFDEIYPKCSKVHTFSLVYSTLSVK